MKRKLILLVVTIVFLVGFGAILHSPPSMIDAVTGATPQVLNAALLKPQDPKKAKAPSRTHAKKKAADAAIVPPTAEKPQPGAVC